ncbi:hypothetical protein Tco_1254339 [Tanacetum coccineum]
MNGSSLGLSFAPRGAGSNPVCDNHKAFDHRISRDPRCRYLEELVNKKIYWNMPPKEGDGAWHIRIELIDPDGEKFKKILQSIPTTRKLSEKENPSEIIDLDHHNDF